MKSNEDYSNYKLTKVRNKSSVSGFENLSFIFSDTCYCGHEKYEHTLKDDICGQNLGCNCRGFMA